MDFLVNDLSIHGQFYNISSFRNAFTRLMDVTKVVKRFDHNFHFHSLIFIAEPIPNMTIQKAIAGFSKDQQRAAMTWLTGGLFCDDSRKHGTYGRMECKDQTVTNSAVGEAAFRTLNGAGTSLISVKSSDWDYSPVRVCWRHEAGGLENQNVDIENWRDAVDLEDSLRSATPPVQSWPDLQNTSMNRFVRLIFTDNCFKPLDGVPFSKSSANRIIFLLDILDRFAGTFDNTGSRTPEGNQIYQDYFTGKNSLFSDSSDTEKRRFEEELMFSHPDDHEKLLFCSWHGKERHLRLRLHFSWPVKAGEPVYIVYVGPKITKK